MAKAAPPSAASLRGQRWRRCDGGAVPGEDLRIYFGAVGRKDQLDAAAKTKVGGRVELRLAFGTVTYTREQ